MSCIIYLRDSQSSWVSVQPLHAETEEALFEKLPKMVGLMQGDAAAEGIDLQALTWEMQYLHVERLDDNS